MKRREKEKRDLIRVPLFSGVLSDRRPHNRGRWRGPATQHAWTGGGGHPSRRKSCLPPRPVPGAPGETTPRPGISMYTPNPSLIFLLISSFTMPVVDRWLPVNVLRMFVVSSLKIRIFCYLLMYSSYVTFCGCKGSVCRVSDFILADLEMVKDGQIVIIVFFFF